MISSSWLEKRRSLWARLEELVSRAGRGGTAALAHEELRQLALLYRQVASDLATVREDPTSNQLASYLNQLLGRAHNIIYLGRRAQPRRIFDFFRYEYPRAFQESFSYAWAALLVFLGGAMAGFLLSLADASFSRLLLGPEMTATIDRREMWTHSVVTIKPLASSGIMTNNMSVAFATFALGITAGLGTAWMLVLNGLLFGTITAACWQAGMLGQLYTFVAPHGVLELPAIFIAGGAGFQLARGLLFPGALPRRAALAQAGGKSVRLLLGTIPMLVIAGVIEGFVSPTDLPTALKLALAAFTFSLLVLYLTRRQPELKPVANGIARLRA